MTATLDDLRAAGYTVTEATGDTYAVSGLGAALYLSADDQATIDSLADPANTAQAIFWTDTPAAAAALATLQANGYTVVRPDPVENVFNVAGGSTSLTGQTPADLVTLAGSLPDIAVATAGDRAAASAGIIAGQLAAVPVLRTQVQTILENLLGEAAAGIPYFEQYALDPSMTAQQWTTFQTLDQTTKDRLLYDAVRTLAALLRYLTGDLPAS